MHNKRKWQLAILLIGIPLPILSTIYDNRYIPLLGRARISPDRLFSRFTFELMAATANNALSEVDKEIGIPELNGLFDLGTLGKAFTLSGRQNPLPVFAQGFQLPYRTEGKIQMQGIAFSWLQELHPNWSVGCSWYFMRTNSRQEFFLKREEVSLPLTDSMVTQIDAIRRKMFQELGFQKNHVGQFGFGDVEGFIRFGDRWDYILKCRSIEAGVRLGALLPSGEWRDENEPASIPLGGNGHYGWYLDADGLFELKEDIKVGVLFQLNKRLPRTRLLRLPIDLEPRIFGVLQERVRVNPGVTLIFSPYFVLENLQKGLGVSVQYSLIKHQEDSWRIVQPNGRGRVKEIIELSEWGQDYFTINIFYDFGKMKKERSFDPILSFKWDIPSMLFMSKNMVRTHKVALGLEFAF